MRYRLINDHLLKKYLLYFQTNSILLLVSIKKYTFQYIFKNFSVFNFMNMFCLSDFLISMDSWQFMYVNFAIAGFFFQIILIVGVYLISNSLPKEKTNKEILEKLYKQPSLSGYYLKNLKF